MPAPQRKIRVLVVEDEIVVSEDLQQRLRGLGYEITGAADTAAEAIALAEATRPDVVLMDIMLHGRPEGIDAAAQLRRDQDCAVIYLTAHSDPATLQRARLTDPDGYIIKPFDDKQLRVAIELAPLQQEMERKTRQVARWLEATLTNLSDAVVATNARGQIMLLNKAAEQLTGWEHGVAVGRQSGEVLSLTNTASGERLPDPAQRLLNNGRVPRMDLHAILATRQGGQCAIDYSATTIVDPEGKCLGVVVVLVDAEARISGAGRLRELSDEVARLLSEKSSQDQVNAELEAFSTAVSHDLRGPLQAIAAFSELLNMKHREHLDSAGQHFLDQVHDNAMQMRRMVEDYLRFLKSNHEQVLDAEAVDVGQLAEDVFTEFAVLPDQKPARLACPALPRAWANEAMVRRVLANLIDNALKYSAPRDVPVVEIGAIPGPDFHTYFVRDNGVGLELAAADKLFTPFQRFHDVQQFPGTGVGLAIVRRIVERHGGRVWAESQPDAGATFFFTLPARAPDQPEPTGDSP